MQSKLFVRNLSWSATEDDLYDLFGSVGEVLSVKIPTRREDGKPRGFAFVEMASAEAASDAIHRLNGTPLDNRELVVDFQEENRDSRPRRDSQQGSGPSTKLFVRNISYSVSEETLGALFEQAGQVVSAKIPIDRDTGSTKGFGFVEMSTVEEAEKAIQTLNETFLEGKSIVVAFQDPNRSKSKPFNKPRGNYNRPQGAWH